MRATCILLLLLTGCSEDPVVLAKKQEQQAYHASAKVVRICRDGSRIWEYKDGRRFSSFANEIKPGLLLTEVCS